MSDHDTIIVRVGSHRARSKMEAAISRLPQGYYSFVHPGEFREVTAKEWDCMKGIPGLTRARVDRDNLHQCWKWE